MSIKCNICNFELASNGEILSRCPRCGATILPKGGCDNCKGCSILKSCKTVDRNKIEGKNNI